LALSEIHLLHSFLISEYLNKISHLIFCFALMLSEQEQSLLGLRHEKPTRPAHTPVLVPAVEQPIKQAKLVHDHQATIESDHRAKKLVGPLSGFQP
jgi:hypothetical protein